MSAFPFLSFPLISSLNGSPPLTCSLPLPGSLTPAHARPRINIHTSKGRANLFGTSPTSLLNLVFFVGVPDPDMQLPSQNGFST